MTGHRRLDRFYGLMAAVAAGVILAAAFAYPSYMDDPDAYSIAYQVGVFSSIIVPALAVLAVGYRLMRIKEAFRQLREARAEALERERLSEWRRVSGCRCEAS